MRNGFAGTIRRIAAVSCLLLLPLGTQAGTPVVYTDGATRLFQVEIPDFWSLRTGGLRDLEDPEAKGDVRDISRLFGMTPDAHDGIWVGIVSPYGVSTLAQAREYLRDIGPFLVQDATVQPAKTLRVNGLPARSVAGRGQRDGRSVDFTVLAIDLPGSRVVVAAVVIESGADLEPLGDVNAMLASIRAVR